MSSYEKHNELARDFVHRVAGQTTTYAEMMVVVESMLAASLLMLVRKYGHSAAVASTMIESAVQAATERFAEIENRKGAPR